MGTRIFGHLRDLRGRQDMLLMNPPPVPEASSSASDAAAGGDLDEEVAQLVGMGFEATSARGDGYGMVIFELRRGHLQKWLV